MVALRAAGVATGWLLGKTAVDVASQSIGRPVPRSTLANWNRDLAPQLEELSPTPLAPAIDKAKIDQWRRETIENLQSAVSKSSRRIQDDNVINNANYRDLAVGMGIAIDKANLLTRRDPAMDAITDQLLAACEGTDTDPYALLRRLVDTVLQKRAFDEQVRRAALIADKTDVDTVDTPTDR